MLKNSHSKSSTEKNTLQSLADKSCSSTELDINSLIENLKKAIESQDQKLNRFELVLENQRVRMRELQAQYQREKDYSEGLKQQLEEYREKDMEFEKVKKELQKLKAQRRKQKESSDLQMDKIIEGLWQSVKNLKEKMLNENRQLKYELKKKEQKQKALKNCIYGFVDKCEQIFTHSDKFEKVLLDEIWRLRRLI